jgi:hypothetical protein
LLLADPGQRGVQAFAPRGSLRPAVAALAGARRALVLTGFPVLASGGGETDGPTGAVTLASALASHGVEAVLATCPTCAPLLEALAPARLEVLDLPPGIDPATRVAAARASLTRLDPSHLVAIERPGRAHDGAYRDMRGRLLSPLVHALDELFLQAEGRTTVAVGDGGNEVGLGGVRDAVRAAVPCGDAVASVVPADHLVVSGVSTWGAYGLCAGLALLTGTEPVLPDPDQLADQLQRIIAAGAVDGVTGEPTATIDGLPLSETLTLLSRLREALA